MNDEKVLDDEGNLTAWVKEYGKQIDWEALAAKDEEVRKLYTNGKCLDFSRPEARHVVARVCLELHWNLKWECPRDRLAPCVPNRVAYLAWLYEEVLPKRDLRVIDVGTGASCIYPLLGSRMFDWSFVATDIDTEAVKTAKANVKLNPDLNIFVIKVDPDAPPLTSAKLLCEESSSITSFDLSMTNPPFFADEEERDSAVGGMHRPEGRAVCVRNEEIVQGGEVEFVKRIHSDPCPVVWKSALLGKKTSQAKLLTIFNRDPKVLLVKSSSFRLGNTVRYLIAWTRDIGQVALPFTFNAIDPIDLDELSRRLEYYFTASKLDYTLRSTQSFVQARATSPEHPHLDFFIIPDNNKTKISVTLVPPEAGSCNCSARNILANFNKIKDSLPGDIAHTNRRWRRRLARDCSTDYYTSSTCNNNIE